MSALTSPRPSPRPRRSASFDASRGLAQTKPHPVEQGPGSRRRFAPACPGRRAARVDFVDQLDKLIPGEGTKAIRGILQSLADIPGLQRAFFGGPVIETAPIGVFEPDGPRRFDEAMKTKPWEEAEQGRKIPGGDPGVRDMAYRPERDGPLEEPGPPEVARPMTPEEEARRKQPVSDGAEDSAPHNPNDLLDPRNWPNYGQEELQQSKPGDDMHDPDALAAEDEEATDSEESEPDTEENNEDDELEEAEGLDGNVGDARLIQVAQTQGQPQQRGPQQGRQRDPQRQQPGQQRQRPAQGRQAPPAAQPQPPAAARQQPAQPVPYGPPVRTEWQAPSSGFRTAVAVAEGGGERESPWDAVNPDSGAMGRYQLTHGALIDARLKSSRNSNGWVPGNPLGIRNDAELRGNQQAQEAAFDAVMRRNHAQLVQNGAYGTIDQPIQGIQAEFRVTQSGLLAAAHRRGAQEVANYMTRMREHGWNSNEAIRGLGPGALAAHREVEKRLKDFANVR